MRIINFIHKNEKYPIDYELLKEKSIYFSELDEELKAEEININLIDEFDSYPDLSSEVIHNFIEYFEKQEINMTLSNIFSFQYLSTKFNVPKLKKKVEEYINDHYAELIDNFLHNYEKEQTINCYQEKLISYHISEYLENEIIQTLPINVISRILNTYSLKNSKKITKTKSKTNAAKKSKIKKKKKNNKKLIKSNSKSNIENEDENDNNENDNNENYNNDNYNNDKIKEEYKIIDFIIRIIQHHGIEASRRK